ncbi:hypothetical protein [Vibrio atlanticus]|uniref:Uncharacterized protein n=1 Tax=Vibrio atlanticus (strain LGP32) TaxID=575788 RepID=B7VS83_VIBA3|nr:hypothetical protein [Vibrio atlanticus]CAV26999.1 Hypothetical protein VS_II1103 [Vibrio atlanticus]
MKKIFDVVVGIVIAILILYQFYRSTTIEKTSPELKIPKALNEQIDLKIALSTAELRLENEKNAHQKVIKQNGILREEVEEATKELHELQEQVRRKENELARLNTELKIRLDDLQHMIEATKLHAVIDYPVIKRTEQALLERKKHDN